MAIQGNSGIRIEGMKEVNKELAKAAATHMAAFEIGVLKAGLHLQATSQKLVPVDTGALRSSAYTKLNKVPVTSADAGGLFGGLLSKLKGLFSKGVRKLTGQILLPSVEVGYTQHYAIYVHEILGNNHPNGGQAKYLEEPARTEQRKMVEIVEKEVYGA